MALMRQHSPGVLPPLSQASPSSIGKPKNKPGVEQVASNAAAKLMVRDGLSSIYKLPTLPNKSPEEIKRLIPAMKANILFDGLSDLSVKGILRFTERMETSPGEVIVQQGEENPWFFIVEAGTFAVYKGDASVPCHIHRPSVWGVWPSFGEFSLLYERAPRATVKSTTAGVLWKLHLKSFQAVKKISSKGDSGSNTKARVKALEHVVIDKDEKTWNLLDEAARASKLLGILSDAQRQKVVEAMGILEIEPGEAICKQGEVHTTLYVVQQGDFEVVHEDMALQEAQLLHILSAQEGFPAPIFNEQALLFNKPRGSTVMLTARSSTKGVLWQLDRDAFSAALNSN